ATASIGAEAPKHPRRAVRCAHDLELPCRVLVVVDVARSGEHAIAPRDAKAHASSLKGRARSIDGADRNRLREHLMDRRRLEVSRPLRLLEPASTLGRRETFDLDLDRRLDGVSVRIARAYENRIETHRKLHSAALEGAVRSDPDRDVGGLAVDGDVEALESAQAIGDAAGDGDELFRHARAVERLVDVENGRLAVL